MSIPPPFPLGPTELASLMAIPAATTEVEARHPGPQTRLLQHPRRCGPHHSRQYLQPSLSFHSATYDITSHVSFWICRLINKTDPQRFFSRKNRLLLERIS